MVAKARTREGRTTKGKSGAANASSIRDLLKGTSGVVRQASTILEEEVAAGIVAAKQAQGRVLKRQARPGGEMSEVMRRFRKDAHDVIDIFMDLVDAAAESFAVLAEPAEPPEAGGRGRPAAKSASPRRRARAPRR